MRKVSFQKGSGNVFRDIGFIPAEAAELARKERADRCEMPVKSTSPVIPGRAHSREGKGTQAPEAGIQKSEIRNSFCLPISDFWRLGSLPSPRAFTMCYRSAA
jgi:hypothetical protein